MGGGEAGGRGGGLGAWPGAARRGLRRADVRLRAALGGLPGRMWAWATGTGPGGRRPTAAFLRRRMLVLPALALIAVALVAAAFHEVHASTERLRDRSVPALVGLAQARTSLGLAQREAELRLLHTTPHGAVELGDTYRTHLTDATQHLTRVAQSRALDRGQEQELRVVAGLVVAYGDKIAWADRNRGSTLLREAGVDYAEGMLRSPVPQDEERARPVGLLDRIEHVEARLRDRDEETTAWSGPVLAAAAVAVLVTALFAFVVVGTCVFLRDRLRLVSLQLLAASVPVLLTPVLLGAAGAQEHGAQQRVRAELAALAYVTGGADAPRRIGDAAAAASRALAGSHADGWSLTADVALPVTVAGALGCGLTLFLYGRPYPGRLPRRKEPQP
ncbi:hypothetical protein [Streptomyces zhihengii]